MFMCSMISNASGEGVLQKKNDKKCNEVNYDAGKIKLPSSNVIENETLNKLQYKD